MTILKIENKLNFNPFGIEREYVQFRESMASVLLSLFGAKPGMQILKLPANSVFQFKSGLHSRNAFRYI